MFRISTCRLISGMVLLLFLLAGQPARAFAQNVKKDDKDPPAKTDKAEEKEPKKAPKLVPAGVLVGRLIKLDEDGFKMEVTIQTYKQTHKQTVDIQLNDDVKVRLPVDVEFDDKGRPKRMKKDPNDKDSRLGGVKGAREDLASNQEIQVTVGRLPNRNLVATVVKVLKKADK
jgi:hypothetical protein